jgi:hypothetical protein
MATLKCTVSDGNFDEPCDRLNSATAGETPLGRRHGVVARALSTADGPTRSLCGVTSGEDVVMPLLPDDVARCRGVGHDEAGWRGLDHRSGQYLKLRAVLILQPFVF